jgi:hypothetical protein
MIGQFPEETEYHTGALIVSVYITVLVGGEDATATTTSEEALATTTGGLYVTSGYRIWDVGHLLPIFAFLGGGW